MRALNCLLIVLSLAPAALAEEPPAWASAAQTQKPMTAGETRQFMKELAKFVEENHLKKAEGSPQRGMIYEYLDFARKGQADQFVQGEALDTMHDGCWFAAAMVAAYRATGDDYYRDFLTRWQLPFYCNVLNHSDELFADARNDAKPAAHVWDKEHALQMIGGKAEKGFVPYFWDDGGSVSLDRRRSKDPLGDYPCRDYLAGKANPQFLLNGYALATSNHMAQDLAVMTQQTWLLMKDGPDDASKKWAAEVAEAAKNLNGCAMRHHGPIPMVASAAGVTAGDAALLRHVPEPKNEGIPDNHYVRALYAFAPGTKQSAPGFADEQEYQYYSGIAKAGGTLLESLAFKLIYDAYTEPMLYRCYSDDAPVPPGVNAFDLHPYRFVDGKPENYRSDRKGPAGKPKPIGSRMGPQNMAMCGIALQALRAHPGIWKSRPQGEFKGDRGVGIFDWPPGAHIDHETTTSFGHEVRPLFLSSSRSALKISGINLQGEVSLKIYARPAGKGAFAGITVKRDKTVMVTNDAGKALKFTATVTPTDQGFDFSLELPYTAAKGQGPWANGIEYGRYSLDAGDGPQNFFLASSEEQVKAWLEYDLAGGLRTWQAVFKEKGFVPSGMGTNQPYDAYSDDGGYAHLITAAAEYLLYLDGKADWEQHHFPKP